MDAFRGVAVDQDGVGIAAGDGGDLAQGILPTFPQPTLVVVLAKIDGVAGKVLAVGRHEADGAAAVQIGADDEDRRLLGGWLLGHA